MRLIILKFLYFIVVMWQLMWLREFITGFEDMYNRVVVLLVRS
jgi:hypothetical protein